MAISTSSMDNSAALSGAAGDLSCHSDAVSVGREPEHMGDVRSWKVLVGLLVDVLADVQGELETVAGTLGRSKDSIHGCSTVLGGQQQQ